MAAPSAKLTRSLARPVALLAAMALLLQSTLLCCIPASAMTADRSAEPAAAPHCHSEQADPSDRRAQPTCCDDAVAVSAHHPSGQPAVYAGAGDFSVLPPVVSITTAPVGEPVQRPLYAGSPAGRSPPDYYLSHCAFLE